MCFVQCDTSCDGGRRSRSVICYVNGHSHTDGSQCGTSKPVDREHCNTHTCPPRMNTNVEHGQWRVGAWSAVSNTMFSELCFLDENEIILYPEILYSMKFNFL